MERGAIDSGGLGRSGNRPGLSELSFRVGAFDDFVREMLDRLVVGLAAAPHEAGPEVPDSLRRPIRINLDSPDDWLVALVKSWATVADVLTFYQERILQEGYLRTAREELSVYQLAHMVGYRPRPGVGGRADLAVTVNAVKGLPEELDLPSGIVVRSVPPPGADPQVFETLEELRARAVWNVLRPPLSTVEQSPVVTGADVRLALQGGGFGLGAGSAVLVTGRLGTEGAPLRAFRLLSEVKVHPGTPSWTEISWADPLVPDAPLVPAAPAVTLVEPEVLGFRQQTGLFGHNAPLWQDLPPDVKQQYQTLEGGALIAGEAGWTPRNRGLPATAVIRCLAVDSEGNLFAGTAADGIFRSTDGGATWRLARRGLQQLDVQALIAGPQGSLYAATPAGGVYRSTDRGEIWEVTSAGLLIGARRGLFQRRGPQAGPLPGTTVRALASARWGNLSLLLAGTDSGVFRSADAGRSWLPWNRGLPGTDPETGVTDLVVSALAVGPVSGQLYAGTTRGVFRSTDGGKRWQPANRGLPMTDPFSGLSKTAVTAVAVYRDRKQALRVLAGTAEGLFLSAAGGEHWEKARLPVASGAPEVLCLAVLDDRAALSTRVYLGTVEGLWTSEDHGESWTRVLLGGPARVNALAVGPEGTPVVVGTPFASFARDWPEYRIEGDHIDLDSVVPGVAAGSWIALRPGDAAGPSEVGIYRVRKVSTVQRRGFSLAATVTRLEVEAPDARLRGFDLRQTRAYLQSEPLPLRPRLRTVVAAAVGVLRAELLTLAERRKVIVTGRTLPRQLSEVVATVGELPASLSVLRDEVAWLSPESEMVVRLWIGVRDARRPDVQEQMRASRLQEMIVALEAQMRVGAPGPLESGSLAGSGLGDALTSQRLSAATQTVTLAVEVVGDLRGVSLTAGELAAALAAPRPVTRPGEESPVYVVDIAVPGSGEPLVLDASTLQVYGNVMTAAEGVTVINEVLGDGNATRANQSFILAKPLAFQRGAGREEPILAVYVQGQLWREVEALHLAGEDGRVYRVQVDHAGQATLTFGDGLNGARLPSGRGNVVAVYRTGMSSRTVSPGGLTLLATRPLGLEAVSNPLRTVPGSAAEDPEEIRRRAPRRLRTLGRIVSLRDYEDFALDFPGIAKAGAWSIDTDNGLVVQITLAATGGAPIPPGDGLLRELLEAIRRCRAQEIPVDIQSYRQVVVRSAAGIQVTPGFLWRDVRSAILGALEREFRFEKSRFEAGISAASVVSAVQRVPGVRAVDLDRFTWEGRDAGDGEGEVARERRARPPAWDPAARRIRAAELVLFDPPDLHGTEEP